MRLIVAAHLIEHGALGGKDAPIRLVGRVGAAENIQRLIETTDVGQRAAIAPSRRRSFGLLIEACCSTAAAWARCPVCRKASA